MLRHPRNSWNSSAAGKYQIVRTTLRGLRRSLGLKGDEVFDAKMQDKLAKELLRQRGYDKFQSGKMDAKTFQANLAKEWASVAHPSTGKSFYGQGTGTSTKAIQDQLKTAQKLEPGTYMVNGELVEVA
jgi:muramidase (phage lysozyme)